jgi:hypothetical protein
MPGPIVVDLPLFAMARSKLERAKRHVAELTEALDAYRDSEPASVHIEPGHQSVTVVLRWQAHPLEHFAILGDAIHNLRTSLDLMASEMARIRGKSDSDVYFPIADAESTLSKAIESKNFAKAGDDAVALLLTLKPFRGGNGYLRALHEMDIQDKHTALVIGNRSAPFGGSVNVSDPTQHSMRVDTAKITFQFGDGPLAGRELIKTLEDAVQTVEGILEGFAALIASRV